MKWNLHEACFIFWIKYLCISGTLNIVDLDINQREEFNFG